MDMLQKLPIEILYLVVQQLDLREAAFVARTCQGLATKLQRYLYRRIDVPAFRDAGRLGEIRRIHGAQAVGIDVPYGLILPVAIAHGQSTFVDFLLGGGWITSDHVRDARQDAYQGWTALSCAAARGSLSLVERLMAIPGVHANLRDFHKATPLHHAAGHGYLDVMNYLLDNGASMNAKNSGAKATPITHACTANASEDTKIAVVALLLRRGADAVSFGSRRTETNVCRALERKHFRLARLLLDNGANTEIFRGAPCRVQLGNAILENDVDRVRLLTDYGAGFNEDGARGLAEYIELAVPSNRWDDTTSIMKLLLEKISGRSPPFLERGSFRQLDRALLTAVPRYHDKLVALMLASGADVNFADDRGNAPLAVAATLRQLHGRSSYEMARALLIHGADPLLHHPVVSPLWSTYRADTTALHAAVSTGNLEILKLFVEHGIDVVSAHGEGRMKTSALHAACTHGQVDVARYLLEAGADPSMKNSNGKSPMHHVAQYGYTELPELLLEYGADFDAKDDGGLTPLLWTCARGHEDLTRLLLEEGASATTSDHDGKTPLHYVAGRFGSVELQNCSYSTALM